MSYISICIYLYIPIYLHLCLYLYLKSAVSIYKYRYILGLGTLQLRVLDYLSSSNKHSRHKSNKRLKQTNTILLHMRWGGLEAKHPSFGSQQIGVQILDTSIICFITLVKLLEFLWPQCPCLSAGDLMESESRGCSKS